MTNSIESIRKQLDEKNKEYESLKEKQLEKLRSGENTSNEVDPKMISLNEGGGPIFFITSYGIKRLYREPENESDIHPTCKKYVDKLQSVDATSQSSISGELGLNIEPGQPCGYENKVVGVKSSGSEEYDKIAYINSDGKLNPFVAKNLDAAGKTCPTEILEIKNDEWDAFSKSEIGIKNGEKCRQFNNSDYDQLMKLEEEIEELQSQLVGKLKTDEDMEEDSGECLETKMKKLQNLSTELTKQRKDMDTSIAMKQQYDLYQIFYKNRIWILIAIIISLLFGLLFFSRSGSGSSTPTAVTGQGMASPATTISPGGSIL
jgi:hypothetical protein